MTIDILTLGVQDTVSLSPISILLVSVSTSFLDRLQQFQPYMLTNPTKFNRMRMPLPPEKCLFHHRKHFPLAYKIREVRDVVFTTVSPEPMVLAIE